MLFIHPDECIDCGLCAPECPQQALFYEDNVPEAWRDFIALNRTMSAHYPRVTRAINSSASGK